MIGQWRKYLPYAKKTDGMMRDQNKNKTERNLKQKKTDEHNNSEKQSMS